MSTLLDETVALVNKLEKASEHVRLGLRTRDPKIIAKHKLEAFDMLRDLIEEDEDEVIGY